MSVKRVRRKSVTKYSLNSHQQVYLTNLSMVFDTSLLSNRFFKFLVFNAIITEICRDHSGQQTSCLPRPAEFSIEVAHQFGVFWLVHLCVRNLLLLFQRWQCRCVNLCDIERCWGPTSQGGLWFGANWGCTSVISHQHIKSYASTILWTCPCSK